MCSFPVENDIHDSINRLHTEKRIRLRVLFSLYSDLLNSQFIHEYVTKF